MEEGFPCDRPEDASRDFGPTPPTGVPRVHWQTSSGILVTSALPTGRGASRCQRCDRRGQNRIDHAESADVGSEVLAGEVLFQLCSLIRHVVTGHLPHPGHCSRRLGCTRRRTEVPDFMARTPSWPCGCLRGGVLGRGSSKRKGSERPPRRACGPERGRVPERRERRGRRSGPCAERDREPPRLLHRGLMYVDGDGKEFITLSL